MRGCAARSPKETAGCYADDAFGPRLVGEVQIFKVDGAEQVMSSVTVSGNRLFFGVGGSDSFRTWGYVVCMSRDTHEVKWKAGGKGKKAAKAKTPAKPKVDEHTRRLLGIRGLERLLPRGELTVGMRDEGAPLQGAAELAYLAAAAYASAVSCAWYELRTSGPDSTCTKPRSSASLLSSANSSGW